MGDEVVTNPSLLIRIRNQGDHRAWSQFVEIYQPLIQSFARKQGLQEADAADLTQETLRAVARAIERLDFDPRKGSFRGWLFTVVRNKLRNFLDAQRRQVRGTGDTGMQHVLEALPSPEGSQEEWDREFERRQFGWAAEQVRTEVQPATWQAFWQTAVEGKSGEEVARSLGMSVAAVYLAKSRTMAKLKAVIRQLHGDG